MGMQMRCNKADPAAFSSFRAMHRIELANSGVPDMRGRI
jgi:hypothetical protein